MMSVLWPLASMTTLRADLALRFVLRLDADSNRLLPLEEYLEHTRAFVNLHAVLAGVVEVELVELAANDLPRLRRLMRLVVPEVEGFGELAVLVDELHAVFLDEVAFLHLREKPGALDGEVGIRNHRLADVEARKVVALEKLDIEALLGQQRRDSGPGRPAANDDNVAGLGRHDHDPRQAQGLSDGSCGVRAAFRSAVRDFELRDCQMAELAAVAVAKRVGDAFEKREPRRADRDEHGAAVYCGARPGDEPALFQLSIMRVMSGARDTSRSARASVGTGSCAARSRRSRLYCWAVRSKPAKNSSSSMRSRSYVRHRARYASCSGESKRRRAAAFRRGQSP